jgi:hypothetical protein
MPYCYWSSRHFVRHLLANFDLLATLFRMS